MQYIQNARRGLVAATLVTAFVGASALLPSAPAAAKAKKKPATAAAKISHQFLASLPVVPRPAFSPTPVLLYRNTIRPAAGLDGISLWVRGDGKGGTLRVRAMASNGASSAKPETPGAGTDTEPLWPAWISKPIVLNFTGWGKIHVATADLIYRAPAGANEASTPAKFSDADTIGIDTNRRSGTIYIDDVAWGGDADGDAGFVVDNFDTGIVPATWRKHGAQDAVVAVLPTISPISKNGAGAMKLDFATHAVIDDLRLTYLRRQIAVQPTAPALIFAPKSPLERVMPDALPEEGEATTRIETFACPEQVQSASFAVYATTSLTNVTVTQKYPLQIVGHRLPTTALDVNVVKVIKEHGSGPLRDLDATAMTPKMLVKDDRVPLSMTDGTPPAIRITGDPVTSIPAHTEKQFWVNIAIPRNTPAGKYVAFLDVTSDQFKQPIEVQLAVDVLPLRLMSPSKQYAINYRGKLGSANGAATVSLTDYVGDEGFQAQLRDIAGHGFRYTTLTDKGDDLWKAVSVYTETGMGYPFLLTGYGTEKDAETVEAARLKQNASRFYYLDVDNSNLGADLAAFKQHQMDTATIVPDVQTMQQVGDNLDLVIYRVDHPYVQKLIANGGDRESIKRDWLYWRSAQSNPEINRLYAGFVLWRSNLYGAFASDYQTSYGTDPFDDTQVAPDGSAPLRPQMLTYPVQGGVIDTVQWEAIREGITDVRYLTTYYAALRECKDNHVAKDTIAESEQAVDAFLSKPLTQMSDLDMQKGRLMIAQYAVKLRKAVDAYYKAHGG